MDEIKIDLNNCCMEVVSEESASIFSGFTVTVKSPGGWTPMG